MNVIFSWLDFSFLFALFLCVPYLRICDSLGGENFSKELALFDRLDAGDAVPVVGQMLAGGGVFVVEVAVILGTPLQVLYHLRSLICSARSPDSWLVNFAARRHCGTNVLMLSCQNISAFLSICPSSDFVLGMLGVEKPKLSRCSGNGF